MWARIRGETSICLLLIMICIARLLFHPIQHMTNKQRLCFPDQGWFTCTWYTNSGFQRGQGSLLFLMAILYHTVGSVEAHYQYKVFTFSQKPAGSAVVLHQMANWRGPLPNCGCLRKMSWKSCMMLRKESALINQRDCFTPDESV